MNKINFMRRLLTFLLVLLWLLLVGWYFRDKIPFLESYLESYLEEPTVASDCQLTMPVSNSDNENACTIKIGIVNTFSDKDGSCHSGGAEHKRGYELALKEINRLGGINGCQVELVQQDDKGDNATARTAVISLAEQGESLENNIPLIIGAYSSGATLVAADEADRQRIPLIVPSASSSLITRLNYEWVFRINADSIDYVKQALAFTATLTETVDEIATVPTIAIIYENTLFGESAAIAVTAKAEQLEIGVVAYESFQKNSDSNSLMAAIDSLKAANPPIVYIISSDNEDSIMILETSRDLEFEPQLFIANAGAFASPDFLKEASPAAENVVVTTQWIADVDWQYDDEIPMNAITFTKTFSDTYNGDTPGMRSVQTYTSLRLAKEVIERAYAKEDCNTDIQKLRTCIQTELGDINLTQTLFGTINFDETGQNDHPVLLGQIVCANVYKANGECAKYRFATVYPEAYRTQEIVIPITEAVDE